MHRPVQWWPLLLGASVAFAGCQFDPALPADAVIRCDNGECPAGYVCRARVGVCVPATRTDVDAPGLVSATLSPANAKEGTTVTLELTASEPLGTPPSVVLAQAGTNVPMQVQLEVPGDQPRYRFTYVATRTELEGAATALVDLVDTSGNAASGLRAGTITFDFTPPSIVQVTYVAPRSADGIALDVKQEEAVEVRLAASEAVRPTVELTARPIVCAGGAPTFRRASVVGGLMDFFAAPPSGTPGCAYGLAISELVDLAGNAAPPTTLTLSAGYRVLEAAPQISDFQTLRFVDGGWVAAGAFSRAPDFNTLGVRFGVGPTASALAVTLDDELLSCSLANCARLAADAGFGCLCERALDGGEPEGLHAVQLAVRDAPGQTRITSRPVRFDWTPPALVPGTVLLGLTPGPGSARAVVSALGASGSARLSFALDEASAAAPVLTATPGPLSITPVSATGTSFAFELRTQAAARGPQQLRARVVDDVGNAADLDLTQAGAALTVDDAAPAAPDTARLGGIVYTRTPWGDAQGTVRFSVVGLPGVVEPGALVRVLDGPSLATALELGRADATDAGSFDVPLLNADRRVVWVSAVDGAGQQSAASDVKDVQWVATLGGKVAGSVLENPHSYELRGVFRRSLTQLDAVEPTAPATVATADTRSLDVQTTESWAARAQPPVARASGGALVYDAERRALVWFEATTARVFEHTTSTGWVLVTPGDPEGDGSPAPNTSLSAVPMAYDVRRAKTVLVLPSVTVGATPDTWEWDGASWRLRQVVAPALTGRSLAYDERREVCVGYRRGQTGPGETWEYDGAGWRRLSLTTQPTAQQSFTLVFDSVSQRVVQYGGSVPGPPFRVIDELWAFDGTQWTNLGPSSGPRPLARTVAALATDPSRGRLVMFGGTLGSGWTNDTWEWTGTAWEARDAGTIRPMAQPSPAMVFDPSRGVVTQMGALNLPAETWDWDGGSWVRQQTPTPTTPGVRTDHALAFDPDRARTVLFGGNFPVRQDTWEWDGQGWAQRADAGPSGRRGHTLVFDTTRRRTLLFGGTNQGDGTAGMRQNNELWEWDGASWQLRAAAGPVERYAHGMAFDEARGRAVLFGGYQAWGTLAPAETWEWDGAQWRLMAAADAGPSARWQTRLSYDARRGVTVLHGGLVGSLPMNDTWEWNGAVWRNVTDAGAPSPRALASFSFDSYSGRSLLIGGTPNVNTDEVWAYADGRWTEATPLGLSGFLPRNHHATAFDSARSVSVVYGGEFRSGSTGQILGDTWELGLRPGDRPGQVARFAFGAAGAEPAASVRGVTVRAWASGTAGAQLWVYSQGSFLAAAVTAADAGVAAPLTATITDAPRLSDLFQGPRQELGVGLTSVGVNAATPAQVVVDAIEVTVDYRRP